MNYTESLLMKIGPRLVKLFRLMPHVFKVVTLVQNNVIRYSKRMRQQRVATLLITTTIR